MKTQTNNQKPWNRKILPILLIFFLFPFFFVSAQAPQSFNYQAVARSNGEVMKNTTLDVRLSLLQPAGIGKRQRGMDRDTNGHHQ
ncbi:MAG: hypothetical protein GXO83_12405 [Chlorobi bacterium]|nr:hypothetical protein [Chlorobiota bacterium]